MTARRASVFAAVVVAAIALRAAEPAHAPLPQSKRGFTDAEIERAANALRRLDRDNAAVRAMTGGRLRESGAYVRYGDDLLAKAWIDAAHAIDNIIEVYANGKAPLILVSGGYVHPNQTPYCEAIEMKESLVRDFGIPSDAILIDPHARHTTTNLLDP